MKQKVNKFIKWAGGLACVVLGLAIGVHGIKQFIPEKQYGGGEIALPKKEEEPSEIVH